MEEDRKNGQAPEETELAPLEEPSPGEQLVRWLNGKLKKIPFLGEYLADVPTLFLMVSDYAKGRYRAVPFFTILGVVVALVYFLSPVDLIPDLLFVLGQVDDIAVVLFALSAAHKDIEKYKQWKQL